MRCRVVDDSSDYSDRCHNGGGQVLLEWLSSHLVQPFDYDFDHFDKSAVRQRCRGLDILYKRLC